MADLTYNESMILKAIFKYIRMILGLAVVGACGAVYNAYQNTHENKAGVEANLQRIMTAEQNITTLSNNQNLIAQNQRYLICEHRREEGRPCDLKMPD